MMRLHKNGSLPLFIPNPMPDEIARGHLGRILLLNQLEPELQIPQVLNKHLNKIHKNGKNTETKSLLHSIAILCNIEPTFYASQHSMLPFLRVAARQGQRIYDHGDPMDDDVVRRNGMIAFRGGARFCKNCVKEDKDYWGFSYWRRSHQVFGLTWCLKHGTPLTLALGEDVLYAPPDHCAEAVALHSYVDQNIQKENPVVNRYAQISLAFLERRMPISGHEASVKIRERAKILGLRIDLRGSRKNLSDHVLEVFPKKWLLTHFPEMSGKKPTAHFSPIDKMCFSSTPAAGQAYGVALASMFDTSEDALNYFYDLVEIPSTPRKYTYYGKNFWKSEKVLNLYNKFGGNHSKIAKALNIRSTTVKQSLHHNGLPSLGKQKKEVQLAVYDFLSGMSMDDACKKNGAYFPAVEKLIRAGAVHLKDAIFISINPRDSEPKSEIRKDITLDDIRYRNAVEVNE